MGKAYLILYKMIWRLECRAMSNEHWPTSPPDGLHPPLPLPCVSTDQLEKLFSDSLNALHFTRKNFVLIARIKEGCLRRKGRQWGQNEDFGLLL